MKKSTIKLLQRINLNQQVINYSVRYSTRAKYLRLQINSRNELEVILPRRYKHEKAEDFIIQKKEWILKHLKEKQKEKYYYFGKEINISVNYDLFLKKPFIRQIKNKLLVSIPSGYNSYPQDEIYNLWLKHKAKIYFPLRVSVLSKQTGFSYNKIAIRSQRTRWGSCSTGKKLSFNYKLMKFRKKVIDYVIIHELCHLKEMNHSKRFWMLVEGYCPDYQELKNELKKNISL